ncbi:ATP-binding protein [Thiomicrorhabdus lithotrophica]|uniref:histidine kinase n=1 Tax=Thiomicrorhabdus lithotrophica TaxID=2949997 RepID=A0ABY8CAF9_9GAMM|nr:ATP-binding protein [Thiomicrorhabdus lithotrophica]WEJ62966.1 ATP-binding protein [Thiomicrorhabdus lithotrophica]
MKSLQHQLSVMLGLSVVLVFLLFWWLSITTIHKVTEDYVLTRLSHDSDAIVKNLHLKDDRWFLDNENLEPIYSQANSGHYFVVKVAEQTFRSLSLNQYPLFLPKLKGDEPNELVYETLGPLMEQGQEVKMPKLLVYASKKIKNNQTITLYVAEDHSPIQESLNRFDWLFGTFALVTLVILYLLQKWVLQRTFKQLTPLERQLKELEFTHQLNIDQNQYPKEVASLIEALRYALNQAGKQLKTSRQSNANLSHALKTPLNLAFQILEQIQLDSSKENLKRVEKQVQEQLSKIYQLIERELRKARIASDAPLLNRFDFETDFQELVLTLKQLNQNKAIQVEINFSKLPGLVIEKEDGFELFGNLLDNSYKWAKSNIVISSELNANVLSLIVEDDGPGVTDDDLNSIQARGFRADETTPGHGIGLSIVKDLVEAYSGEIEFSHSNLGGLKIKLDFKTH